MPDLKKQKQEFLTLCRENIKRDGLEDLLGWLQPPMLQIKTSTIQKPRKPQRFAGFLYPFFLSQYLPFSPV